MSADLNMGRRTFLGCSSAAPFLFSSRASKSPNIVYFLADDLGYADLSCYGCRDTRTPHIDSIARRGVKFTQSYANAPECTPTRTALLSGRYQHRVGGLECAIGVGNVGRYDEASWLCERGELGLPPTETVLPRLLKERGYDTACFGKWHLGYPKKFWPEHHGFDVSFGILGGNADYFTHREDDGLPVLFRDLEFIEKKGYITDLIAEETCRWLRRPRKNPFFLYVAFTAPHMPIQVPDDYRPELGTAPRRNGDRAAYAKVVESMDAAVGKILRRLDEMGAISNTLVVFTSDNGANADGRNTPLRGNKGRLWEGGIRVPCIAQWPGRIPEGSVSAQVNATFDWTETILRSAGADCPSGRPADGIDLMPVITGRKPAFARTLFWRAKRDTRIQKAVRHGYMKLIMIDGEKGLYDLAADGSESQSLAASRDGLARELERKILAWEKDVAAPRLRDFAPRTINGG